MLLDETYPLASSQPHAAARSLSAGIEKVYDQATALEVPRFKLAGLRRKPGDMLNFLRSHGARARRHTMPVKYLALDCYTPDGSMAVEVSFGDSSSE
ncbi:hypothetical protein [Pararhizobium sp. IMCC21322]|uniref:hypothetical protein n=1 Tax=Pararhizobium sp. IMCC21322 TaxID=3067903 RepID=UPI0027423194|nr:hypothetical protein [Pararhizobium sp. IMCC21322]